MERGDIYLVSLDPVSGHEQYGERPVLIVSPGTFNRVTGTPHSGGRPYYSAHIETVSINLSEPV